MDLTKISVVLPSLDPDEKLIAVIDGLLEYGFSDINFNLLRRSLFLREEICSLVISSVESSLFRVIITSYPFCFSILSSARQMLRLISFSAVPSLATAPPSNPPCEGFGKTIL